MSLRKSLRRSLRSSYKVKSSDEGQVKSDSSKMATSERTKGADVAKMSASECTRSSDVTGYLTADDVTVRLDCPGPSSGVTLEASNSSFESHDDVTAAGAYQSSESEDDLIFGDRQYDPTCPDNALYEFIFRACALMALENDDLKQIIEQQQQQGDEKKDKSEEEEDKTSKQEPDGVKKKGKKPKVRTIPVFFVFFSYQFIFFIFLFPFIMSS